LKYRVFLKPIDKDDIEIVKSLPTDKPYTEAKFFNNKEEAEIYIIANTSWYIIREEEDPKPETKAS
jgi:hypothetical protein